MPRAPDSARLDLSEVFRRVQLGAELGVSSDQAVIELLQRLEVRGLIERSPGQARGIRLTIRGCVAIGIPPDQLTTDIGGSGPLAAPVELNPQQQLISERLSEIDPRLSAMYVGALHVLRDASNPERIPQAAHSIRESTKHLSDLGKPLLGNDESGAAKDSGSSNARQLEKVFDPLGGVRHIEQTVYNRWNVEHRFFVEVSHHARNVSIEEFLIRLSGYEDFLASYVLRPQAEIYTIIDEKLAMGPDSADPDRLNLLLTRNLESYRYLLRKADARWLSFAWQHKLLTSARAWEMGDYLSRNAGDAPDEVFRVIQETPTGKSDSWLRLSFIDAALKMPDGLAAQLIQKMQDEAWFTEEESWLAFERLCDLMKKFLGAQRYSDALRLTRVALDHWASAEKDLPVARSRTDNYHHGQLLKILSEIPVPELDPFIRLLVELVAKAISDPSAGGRDGSAWWRPAIEEHEQNWGHDETKELLLEALREALERYIDASHLAECSDAGYILDGLLQWNPPYAVFTRLKLHLYRLHASLFAQEIEQAIISEFDNVNVWHEYALLLTHAFPKLSSETRKRLMALIDRGPAGDREEGSVRRWKARKLALIHQSLSPVELDQCGDLLPTAREIEQPTFLLTHGSWWIGPTSPASEEQLKSMSIDSLLSYLEEWNPTNDWHAPSREGIGRQLSSMVAKNSLIFSLQATRFFSPRLRPCYTYHFLLGLRDSLRNAGKIDWPAALTLAHSIIESAKARTLPVFAKETDEEEDWESTWDSVYQEIGSLIAVGLGARQADGPDLFWRDNIWDIVSFLCEHPDPTPAYEEKFGGNNMEPYTLSINTVRGQAFHTLFAYIFWCDRHVQDGQARDSRIPEEAKRILEAHLDLGHDPSLTVRSVYGRYFPWLFVYDRHWASGLVHRLFPMGDGERRYAAWETYLSNPVFEEVYRALKPQYNQAIVELRTFKKERKYWADPVQRLADHMVIAYAYEMDSEEPVWRRFFQLANAKQRGMAVRQAGWLYVKRQDDRSGDRLPETGRLQEFWEWRLQDSRDIEELREFGWWVSEDKFDEDWMLEQLIQTLERTGGAVEDEHNVLSVLAALALDYSERCSRALALMVKSRSADRLVLGHDESLWQTLLCLQNAESKQIQRRVADMIDHLLKLGLEKFRSLPMTQWTPPPVSHRPLLKNQKA